MIDEHALMANLDTHTQLAALADQPQLFTIAVHLGQGDVHRIEAMAGFNAMELMRAGGIPVIAECGGAGVCATCHCRVPESWAAKLPQPTDEEQEKLDELPSADDRSRLSCQIQVTDTMDGLVLELQADSIKRDGLNRGVMAPRFLHAAE